MNKSACIVSVFDNEGDLVSYCIVDNDYYIELLEIEEDGLYHALNDTKDSRVIEHKTLKDVFTHLFANGLELVQEDRVYLA
jgi:hypothetical protein